ncbi:MAG: hypothetical protein JO250_17400 [Armatimonadetes bacterium]|nr:hypothetical protein [Armatimonadota bacterium]
MLKLSRPVVYTFVAAVAVYAVVLLTQPDTPVRHTVPRHTVRRAAGEADGITEADLTAHFARYVPGKRDPFVPKVVPPKAAAGRGEGPGGARDAWTLTGIYAVNDTLNALVENRATGDSVSLKAGDRWRGLRVVSIGSDAVRFQNALGQQTRLAFAPPPAEGPGARTAGGAPTPALRVVGPLRPMPIVGPLPPLPTAAPPPQTH